jgi:hypothetical protein
MDSPFHHWRDVTAVESECCDDLGKKEIPMSRKDMEGIHGSSAGIAGRLNNDHAREYTRMTMISTR